MENNNDLLSLLKRSIVSDDVKALILNGNIDNPTRKYLETKTKLSFTELMRQIGQIAPDRAEKRNILNGHDILVCFLGLNPSKDMSLGPCRELYFSPIKTAPIVGRIAHIMCGIITLVMRGEIVGYVINQPAHPSAYFQSQARAEIASEFWKVYPRPYSNFNGPKFVEWIHGKSTPKLVNAMWVAISKHIKIKKEVVITINNKKHPVIRPSEFYPPAKLSLDMTQIDKLIARIPSLIGQKQSPMSIASGLSVVGCLMTPALHDRLMDIQLIAKMHRDVILFDFGDVPHLAQLIAGTKYDRVLHVVDVVRDDYPGVKVLTTIPDEFEGWVIYRKVNFGTKSPKESDSDFRHKKVSILKRYFNSAARVLCVVNLIAFSLQDISDCGFVIFSDCYAKKMEAVICLPHKKIKAVAIQDTIMKYYWMIVNPGLVAPRLSEELPFELELKSQKKRDKGMLVTVDTGLLKDVEEVLNVEHLEELDTKVVGDDGEDEVEQASSEKRRNDVATSKSSSVAQKRKTQKRYASSEEEVDEQPLYEEVDLMDGWGL